MYSGVLTTDFPFFAFQENRQNRKKMTTLFPKSRNAAKKGIFLFQREENQGKLLYYRTKRSSIILALYDRWFTRRVDMVYIPGIYCTRCFVLSTLKLNNLYAVPGSQTTGYKSPACLPATLRLTPFPWYTAQQLRSVAGTWQVTHGGQMGPPQQLTGIISQLGLKDSHSISCNFKQY